MHVVSTNQFVMIGDVTQELQHSASTVLFLQFLTCGVQLISRVIKDANLLWHREMMNHQSAFNACLGSLLQQNVGGS